MGTDGWLGIGWPKEWGGQGRSAIEQFIFFDESMRSGAPVPMLTINTVGPDHHELRHAGAEGVLPPQDPGRRDPLLHRLHRAELGHRPGLADHPGRARRRRVRDQRLQDLHQPGRRRRLHLAGHPDRSQRGQAQGHLHVRGPDGHARHPRGADEAAGRPQHQLHVLRGRAGSGHRAGRRGEPGLEPHHQPAQPRAGHAVLARDHRAGAHRRAGLGPGDQAARRPARRRPGVGAGAPGPGPRRARVPPPHQLEGGVAGDAGPPRRGRRLDRSRSSAPSSTCGPSAR